MEKEITNLKKLFKESMEVIEKLQPHYTRMKGQDTEKRIIYMKICKLRKHLYKM